MSHLSRRFLAVATDESGGSLIETAFVASVFLGPFFGVWDFANAGGPGDLVQVTATYGAAQNYRFVV